MIGWLMSLVKCGASLDFADSIVATPCAGAYAIVVEGVLGIGGSSGEG